MTHAADSRPAPRGHAKPLKLRRKNMGWRSLMRGRMSRSRSPCARVKKKFRKLIRAQQSERIVGAACFIITRGIRCDAAVSADGKAHWRRTARKSFLHDRICRLDVAGNSCSIEERMGLAVAQQLRLQRGE